MVAGKSMVTTSGKFEPQSVAPAASEPAAAGRRRWGFAWLGLGILLLYLVNLGGMSLWDNDEPLYGQIAREMLRSGDFLTPVFRGEIWFCHPPLYFWLTALAGSLIGWSEFTLRIWPALFGVAGVVLAYFWGAGLWDRRAGIWSALILATSLEYFSISHLGLLDSMFAFFLSASLLGLYLGYARHDRKASFWGLAAAGAAMLAKGPLGLVYPFMVLVPFLALRRELGRLKEIPWLWGGLTALGLGGFWYIIESVQYGNKFIEPVFDVFTMERVFTPVMLHGGPLYYYLPVICLGFFPWIGLLPRGLVRAWKCRQKPEYLWLLVWSGITFFFFTLAQTKLPNYVLSLFPALALMVARSWDPGSGAGPGEEAPGRSSWNWALGAVLAVVGLLAAGVLWFGLSRYPHELRSFGWVLAVFLGVPGLGIALALWAANRPSRIFPGPLAVLAATAVAFQLGLMLVVFPATEAFKTSRPLARTLNGNLQPAERLVIYRVPNEFSLNFYTDHEVARLRHAVQVIDLLRGSRRVFAVIPQAEAKVIQAGGGKYYVWDTWAQALLISNRPPPFPVPSRP